MPADPSVSFVDGCPSWRLAKEFRVSPPDWSFCSAVMELGSREGIVKPPFDVTSPNFDKVMASGFTPKLLDNCPRLVGRVKVLGLSLGLLRDGIPRQEVLCADVLFT